MQEKLKCASFFAGIGGIDIGFEGFGEKKSDTFEVVYANEIDPYVVRTYELNFPTKVDTRDIREVAANPSSIPDFDVMLAGFPCQPFSIGGYRQGFNDERGRGTMFFELIKLIRAKQPRIIFLENVKNLVSHNDGDTFETILDALKQEGYGDAHWQVMNAIEYGNMPQTRERIYIVAFKDKEARERFHMPSPVELTTKLGDIIDFDTQMPENLYYRKGQYKFCHHPSGRTGDVFEELDREMDDPNTVYQWRRWYVRKNKSGAVPTLTANMGGGGHNVPVVRTKYGIRKLTVRECLNAQGFPKSYKMPEDLAPSRLYKQTGNSVCVGVVSRIASAIEVAIRE